MGEGDSAPKADSETCPPLYAVGVATPPPSAEAFWLETADGERLRAAFWPAPGEARGAVALFNGRTEFIEKFYEPVERLRHLGFCVLTFDWRGQGLSSRALPDRRAGYVRDFDEYQRDVDAALGALAERAPPGAPWLLAAHSMGGAIAARTLMRQSAGGSDRPPGPGFAAAVLSAPMLGLHGAGGGAAARIAAGAITLVGGGAGYTPGGSRTPLSELGFKNNVLTSDPDRFETRYAALIREHPDVALGGATWSWLSAARAEMAALRPVDVPTLLVLGDAEEVVSAPAIRDFANRAPQAELLVLDGGARHEPFMERDPIQVRLWDGVAGFFDRFLDGAPKR